MMTPQALTAVENMKLRERIRELEIEISEVRKELVATRRNDETAKIAVAFGLTMQEAALLHVLYLANGLLPVHVISHRLPAVGVVAEEREPKIVDVVICKVRRKLGDDIIKTVFRQGRRLSDEGRELVRKALANEPFTLPQAPRSESRGGGKGSRLLTAEEVQAIRRFAGRVPLRELAARYEVSTSTIGRIQYRELYSDVPDPSAV